MRKEHNMNKNVIIKGLIFLAGAAVGSVVTYGLLDRKYEERIKKDRDSLRALYEKYKEKDESNDEDKIPVPKETNESIEKCKQILEKEGYRFETVDKAIEEDDDMPNIHIISPEEFGDSDYPCISLMYHTDGVVSNDNGKIVTNVEELIGNDFMNHFGEYEYDSVFVRNDDMEIDYEILRDYKGYSEID